MFEDMNKKLFIITLFVVAAIGFMWFALTPKAQEYSNGGSDGSADQAASTYSSDKFGFRVAVPDGFVPDTDYINFDLGPGHEIAGVGFHIPATFSQGTNLSTDSHVAIERLNEVSCTPADFLDSPSPTETTTRGSNSFAVAHQVGAAAGNLYDETVYVTEKDNHCYAVRYFIHSSNIGNYPAGTVKEFDRASLLASFDRFLGSLVIY